MPRSAKSNRLKLPPPPGPEEWDFDQVPEEELLACCYWEYARDSAWIRDLQRRCDDPRFYRMTNTEAHRFVGEDIMRLQTDWASSHVLGGVLFSGSPMLRPEGGAETAIRGDCANVPRFPCPWQQLPEAARTLRAAIPDFRKAGPFHAFRRGRFSTAEWLLEAGRAALGKRLSADPARPGWRPGQSILFAGAEHGIFEIGWGCYTNEEITGAFTKWVKCNRPEEMPAPDRRGHRLHDFRVALRRLGIMRLLHVWPLSKVAEQCPAAWKKFRTYEWFKERKRAAETFRKLLHFLPADEMPGSWPTPAANKNKQGKH